MVGQDGGCPIERHIELAEKKGASAAIVIGSWESCNFQDQQSSKFKYSIPAVCICYNVAFIFGVINLTTSGNFTEIILTQENNYIQNMKRASIITFQFFFFSFFFVTFVLSIYRLILFIIKDKTTYISLPKTTLVLVALRK